MRRQTGRARLLALGATFDASGADRARRRISCSWFQRSVSSRTTAAMPVTDPPASLSNVTVDAVDRRWPSLWSDGTRRRSLPYFVTPVDMTLSYPSQWQVG